MKKPINLIGDLIKEKGRLVIDYLTALEWYESGDSFKEELALKLFSKDDLEYDRFLSIRTFEDACKEIGVDYYQTTKLMSGLPKNVEATWKLSIIRQAINGDWRYPDMVRGKIYYFLPSIRPEDYSSDRGICKFEDIYDNKKFIISLGPLIEEDGGLIANNDSFNYGRLCSNRCLLGCVTPNRARHLVTSFGEIIFEALCGQNLNYRLVKEENEEE